MALLLRSIARGELKRGVSVCGADFETHPHDNDFVSAWIPNHGAIPCLTEETRKWLKKKEKGR